MSQVVTQSIARGLRRPSFIVAAAVLAVSALGLNAAVSSMEVHFRKQRVELRLPLASVGRDLGPWRQITRDQALTPDVEDVLGTDEYIMRQYANEEILGPEIIAALRDETLSPEQRQLTVQSAFRAHPEAFVNLSVTYYTGLVDTVPHVPDRCMVADGYEPAPSDNNYPRWTLAGRDEPLEVRFINFEDQSSAHRQSRSVAYVFHVNGRYEPRSLAVRRTLQHLFERNAYYAKVEVMALLDDPDRAARVLGDFLGAALGDVERALPDWSVVTAAQPAGD